MRPVLSPLAAMWFCGSAHAYSAIGVCPEGERGRACLARPFSTATPLRLPRRLARPRRQAHAPITASAAALARCWSAGAPRDGRPGAEPSACCPHPTAVRLDVSVIDALLLPRLLLLVFLRGAGRTKPGVCADYAGAVRGPGSGSAGSFSNDRTPRCCPQGLRRCRVPTRVGSPQAYRCCA